MPTKVLIEPELPVSVMSKSLFRHLRLNKYKFFTAENIIVKIGELDFCGQFTSKVMINNNVVLTTFYVKDSNEDFAIINKKVADQLGLGQNLKVE